MNPQLAQAILQTAVAIRSAADTIITLLGEALEQEPPCPSPSCPKARWEDLTTAGASNRRLHCLACGWEYEEGQDAEI